MSTRRSQSINASYTSGLDKLGAGVLLYAYAVLLGASYLFAFWRPIGFNVFPYLGLQDYVGAPLNRVSVLVATPLVLAAIVFGVGQSDDRSRKMDAPLYLTILYAFAFLIETYKAVSRYWAVDFKFANEANVLFIAALLFCAGVAAAYYSYRSKPMLHIQIAGLILVQSSVSMAAGYSDGKAVYTGALEVHFLENRDLCETGGLRDWVLLGAYGGQTFFMNTIDKRLCLTAEKNIRLVSRQVKDSSRKGQ